MSEFAEHFPYHGQSLWVIPAHNAAQDNDVLRRLLAKKATQYVKKARVGLVHVSLKLVGF